jgi:hypothetical protein
MPPPPPQDPDMGVAEHGFGGGPLIDVRFESEFTTIFIPLRTIYFR